MSYKANKEYFADKEKEMQVNKIENLIDRDEEILWESKPKKSAYILSKCFKMLPLALLWLAFDGTFIGFMIVGNVFANMPWFGILGICAFFALHLAPVWIWIGGITKGWLEHRNIHYVMTDKRLFIRDGVIPDITILMYKDIASVNCTVGLIDRILKVGDLTIKNSSFDSYYMFDVKNPYKVTSVIQRIITDIQSDIMYPNALRPEENPGYNTKYRPKIKF